MLLVRTEYRKGIFFVRLLGRLDNESAIDKIYDWILLADIKIIVINFTEIFDISVKSISHVIQFIRKIRKEKRLVYVCDENNLGNYLFGRYVPVIKKEVEAFSFLIERNLYE